MDLRHELRVQETERCLGFLLSSLNETKCSIFVFHSLAVSLKLTVDLEAIVHLALKKLKLLFEEAILLC